MTKCMHPSWSTAPGAKHVCDICGAIGEERRYLSIEVALSQPAPQGVAEVMELVRGYAIACVRANRDGGYDDRDAFWKEAMSAITAIVQERDALKARVAELEQDAAHARHIRAAGFALSNIAFNLKQREGGILTAAECKTLAECQANWDAAITAAKEPK